MGVAPLSAVTYLVFAAGFITFEKNSWHCSDLIFLSVLCVLNNVHTLFFCAVLVKLSAQTQFCRSLGCETSWPHMLLSCTSHSMMARPALASQDMFPRIKSVSQFTRSVQDSKTCLQYRSMIPMQQVAPFLTMWYACYCMQFLPNLDNNLPVPNVARHGKAPLVDSTLLGP